MKIKFYQVILTILVLLSQSVLAKGDQETGRQHDKRIAWWRDARFGMFIHWDMSSVAGTEISWSRKATKPLDVTNDKAGYVEDPEYDNLYKKFDPEKFNADEWVKIAKDAGMKYLVFTTKHHGGFCMWNTKYTDYSIMNTSFKRDVVKELSDACHKAGLRFGLYYSPRDWHHPDYGIGDNRMYHEYIKGQLTELLTNYGKVDVIWFDSYGHGASIQYWHADEILSLVKRLQPKIVINNRCNFFGEKDIRAKELLKGDFDTPEQHLGAFQYIRPWESCMCIVNAPGGGWSYRPDGTVKSFTQCMKNLLGCASGDGNLLLDVGPNALGVIPVDQVGPLSQMGEWLKKYGVTIYGTRGGPFRNGIWGGSTHKGKTIWLHIAKWKGDKLELPALKSKIRKYTNLTHPAAQPVVEQTEKGLTISLAAVNQDKIDTIIQLDLDGSAEKEMINGLPL